jgi:hypothetical protein
MVAVSLLDQGVRLSDIRGLTHLVRACHDGFFQVMDKRLEPVLRPAAMIGSVAELRPSFVAIFLFANGDF